VGNPMVAAVAIALVGVEVEVKLFKRNYLIFLQRKSSKKIIKKHKNSGGNSP